MWMSDICTEVNDQHERPLNRHINIKFKANLCLQINTFEKKTQNQMLYHTWSRNANPTSYRAMLFALFRRTVLCHIRKSNWTQITRLISPGDLDDARERSSTQTKLLLSDILRASKLSSICDRMDGRQWSPRCGWLMIIIIDRPLGGAHTMDISEASGEVFLGSKKCDITDLSHLSAVQTATARIAPSLTISWWHNDCHDRCVICGHSETYLVYKSPCISP